jgi:hypothetical protein
LCCDGIEGYLEYILLNPIDSNIPKCGSLTSAVGVTYEPIGGFG